MVTGFFNNETYIVYKICCFISLSVIFSCCICFISFKISPILSYMEKKVGKNYITSRFGLYEAIHSARIAGKVAGAAANVVLACYAIHVHSKRETLDLLAQQEKHELSKAKSPDQLQKISRYYAEQAINVDQSTPTSVKLVNAYQNNCNSKLQIAELESKNLEAQREHELILCKHNREAAKQAHDAYLEKFHRQTNSDKKKALYETVSTGVKTVSQYLNNSKFNCLL